MRIVGIVGSPSAESRSANERIASSLRPLLDRSDGFSRREQAAGDRFCDKVAHPVRVVVVPGLHDSGPAHWQTWLQRHSRHALRVNQRDWSKPDLERWADRIETTLSSQPPARWIAVGHSFGCLALARYLSRPGSAQSTARRLLRAALLVAPADPRKFGVVPFMPAEALPLHCTVIGSETDPWMTGADARHWAARWGARFISLGDAGHINTEAGFGPLPKAKAIVSEMARRLAGERRNAAPATAHPAELAQAR